MKQIFIFLVFVGAIGCIGIVRISSNFNKINLEGIEVLVDLESGTNLKSLSTLLESKGVVPSSLSFRIWVKLFSDYSKYQAGSYKFSSVSIKDIDRMFIEGKTYSPVVLTVLIPEGFTVKKTIARLVASGVGDEQSIKNLIENKEFLKSKGITGSSVEGYLYPSTYVYRHQPEPSEVISQMIDTFWSKLPENYIQNVEKMGLTLDQAVIFASLIEQETFGPEEMNKVSEVIWNRLKRKEPLGIDSSIIYGIEKYSGDIKTKDLKNKKNPYNTRVHKGLPPTAIGSVSTEALQAVLSPTSEGYYYFVVDTSDPTRHIFTRSLKEHNKHVKKLISKTKNGQTLVRPKK